MADQIKKLSAGHSIEVLDAIMTEVEEARGEHESLDARLDEISGEGYSKAEVDALLALKQNVLNSAQLAAANSGIDSEKVAQYDSTTELEAEDRAALVELVDGGAKNIADMSKSIFTTTQKDGVTVTLSGDSIVSSGNSGTNTNNFFNVYFKSTTEALIPSGTWIAAIIGTGIDNFRIEVYDNTKSDMVKGEFGQALEFTIDNGVTGSYVRITNKPSTDCTGSYKLLICTKAAWDISHAYQPYRPSYQELYDMVKALQPVT